MKKYLTFLLILLIPFLVFAEDLERSKEISLTDTDFNINEYFSLISKANWVVADPSVASVVDGNIIPIKVGTTTISTIVNGNSYLLNLSVINSNKNETVTNKDINQVMEDVDVKNPKTGDAMILLIMVISLSLVTSFFLSYMMKHNKYEEE